MQQVDTCGSEVAGRKDEGRMGQRVFLQAQYGAVTYQRSFIRGPRTRYGILAGLQWRIVVDPQCCYRCRVGIVEERADVHKC